MLYDTFRNYNTYYLSTKLDTSFILAQTCSRCGHYEKAIRQSQAEVVCLKCHLSINADENAAKNIKGFGQKPIGQNVSRYRKRVQRISTCTRFGLGGECQLRILR